MKYIAPEMEIVMFETEEVIVASAEVTTTTSSFDDVIDGGED